MSRVLSIGGTVYFVQYLQGSLQLGVTAAGRLLVPVFVARMAAGMLGGKLLSRFHPGRVIASGYLARALGAAGTAVAVGVGPPPLLLVVPLVVWGAPASARPRSAPSTVPGRAHSRRRSPSPRPPRPSWPAPPPSPCSPRRRS